jgi:hypothetical protein
MAHQNPGSRRPVTWAVLTILILAPIVGTLWVPFYARATPRVADFPFFYWYQLIWVPIVAVTSALAYILMRRTGHPRGGPDARGAPGGPAGPGGSARPDGPVARGAPGGPDGPDSPAARGAPGGPDGPDSPVARGGPGPAPPATSGRGGVQTP